MWILYAAAALLLGYEALVKYNNRPSKYTSELYEDARRERLRHLGQRGDESYD